MISTIVKSHTNKCFIRKEKKEEKLTSYRKPQTLYHSPNSLSLYIKKEKGKKISQIVYQII